MFVAANSSKIASAYDSFPFCNGNSFTLVLKEYRTLELADCCYHAHLQVVDWRVGIEFLLQADEYGIWSL